MISFYLYSSHKAARESLRKHLWSEEGLEKRMSNQLKFEHYGTELRSILVGVYAEGDILIDAPKEPRVGRVSKKDKSLRIDLPVDPEILIANDHHAGRLYLIQLISSALRAPVNRRKWDFDFIKLASDFERVQMKDIRHSGGRKFGSTGK